jgi:hypothetical protein
LCSSCVFSSSSSSYVSSLSLQLYTALANDVLQLTMTGALHPSGLFPFSQSRGPFYFRHFNLACELLPRHAI